MSEAVVHGLRAFQFEYIGYAGHRIPVTAQPDDGPFFFRQVNRGTKSFFSGGRKLFVTA